MEFGQINWYHRAKIYLISGFVVYIGFRLVAFLMNNIRQIFAIRCDEYQKIFYLYTPISSNFKEIRDINDRGTRQTVFRIIICVMRLATFSGLHRLALSIPRLDHGRKNVYWIYDGLKRRSTNSGHWQQRLVEG